MRTVGAVSALLLVAGCSAAPDGGTDQAGETASTPSAATSTSATSTSAPSTPPSQTPTGPPPADAPVAAVMSWVQAGPAADPAAFHTATRADVTTALGDGIAFVTPSGRTQCRTDAAMTDGALACLVELADPPPAPADVYGQWIGNWVDFDGATAQIGSVHGDPGPFTVGTGPELPYGSSLRFGDYQCRTDPEALFCVNFARRTALRMSDAGVIPFGCLGEVPAQAGGGIRFECG